VEIEIETKPGIGTCVAISIGVDVGNDVTLSGVTINCVGVERGVGVFAFCPTSVGVEVKVGVGTVGVKVGASVGVLVKNVGTTVAVDCIPRNSFNVMEQAERNVTKIRRRGIFFMRLIIP
jgi:hypothetical protein